MPIIDVHAHHVPASVVHLVGYDTGRGGVMQGDMVDLSVRIADMDSQGVEMQAVSGVGGTFGRDLETARAFNDAMAESLAPYPDRFVGLAIAPLAEPESAPSELERAVKDLGMRGVAIGSHVNGKNLDEPEFGAFFRKVEELDIPMFIHPVSPQLGLERLGRYHLANMVGNVTETAVAAASLIFGRVLDEFPKLKPYLAHGGGSCPYISGRWDHGWLSRGEGGMPAAPTEYLQRLYYDSLTHSQRALEYLVRFAGSDHIMLGSDYPYSMGEPGPVQEIESTPGLSDGEKREVLSETASELFKVG